MATITRQANGSNSLTRSSRRPLRNATPTRRRTRPQPHDMKSSAAADVDVELLKAVAQAWHAQSGNPRPSRALEIGGGEDHDAGVGSRPRAGAARHPPSRFKLEAVAAAASPTADAPAPREGSWDFARSLWDTYELVSIARKLESGLAITDYAAAGPQEGSSRGEGKRSRESGCSLRRLLLRSSSRRFEE